MPTMTFDFDGLIGLLARNLYSDKGVFIRELVQNAHDSIMRRRAAEGSPTIGRIDIRCDLAAMVMEVRDDGEGMGRLELKRYLSVVGSSGTRTRKGQVAGMIGQFGIGFLSAFLVAGQVKVLTRKQDEAHGWLWVNEGTQDYRIEPAEVGEPGTVVQVVLRSAAERGEIHPERVRQLVRKYADLLDVPVYVDGEGPVNRRSMPWEQGEGREAAFAWVEEVFHESPMEVIPLHLADPPVRGLLYVSRTRMLEGAGRSRVRVYCNRMYLRDESETLLPEWAYFIGGMIDTSALTPTAARDNFQDDHDAARLRVALSEAVGGHLLALASQDPKRLSDIVGHHDFGIKAACRASAELLPKVWDLLHWRVNDGKGLEDAPRPLPAILEGLARDSGGVVDLPIFTQRDVANQYFAMANAAGMTVIDASRLLDEELLVRWAGQRPDVRLVRVDRDDGALLGRMEGAEARRFQPLAHIMGTLLREHVGPIEVEVRRIEPGELPIIFRAAPNGEAHARAQQILSDSTATPEMRSMARALVDMAPPPAHKVILNARNALIQRLARSDAADRDVATVIIALFEGALLGSQEILSPEAARHFRAGFHRLLERHLVLAQGDVAAPALDRVATWPSRRVMH